MQCHAKPPADNLGHSNNAWLLHLESLVPSHSLAHQAKRTYPAARFRLSGEAASSRSA
jgi:hypothetical protein